MRVELLEVSLKRRDTGLTETKDGQSKVSLHQSGYNGGGSATPTRTDLCPADSGQGACGAASGAQSACMRAGACMGKVYTCIYR